MQSIKANDYPDYEVIIVDCTEKKEIEKFVEKYQDKRIRVKRGEKIWTAAKRKNEGAGCAEVSNLLGWKCRVCGQRRNIRTGFRGYEK